MARSRALARTRPALEGLPEEAREGVLQASEWVAAELEAAMEAVEAVEEEEALGVTNGHRQRARAWISWRQKIGHRNSTRQHSNLSDGI